MKYKKITILMILAMFLFICSLSTISAANNTINDTSTGGIAQGITDTGPGDTLFLQPGTYNKTNQDINITISKNITIKGNGSTNNVIIDAQGLLRIFTISGNTNVTFINITFTNSGNVAIYSNNLNSPINFINCTFTNNKVTGSGSAMYTRGNNSAVTNCIFINNTASSTSGAIYSGAENFAVINCTFINNTSNSSFCGALYINSPNSIVANSTFIGNRAGTGGGAIYNNINSNSIITNCTFINNTAPATSGGAIINYNSANVRISNCTFIDNRANTVGGAINNNNGNNFTVTNCTFINNTANNGGAIHNNIGDNFIVNNSNFTNNKAVNSGGSIFNSGTGNMSVFGNTMSGNGAGLGQMIYNAGTMGALNLTFINNSTWVVKNGSIITLYAILVDDMGNTVTGQNISFYLDGIFFENVTAIEGYANIIYTPSSAGDIPVSGEYAGIGMYSILINNGLLKVRIPTKITINVPKEVKVGDTVNLESKLTDEDGNPLAGKTVDFYVDGVKVGSGITDADGIAKLNYTFTKSGKPNVEAKFAGDNTYMASNATNRTTVSKIPTITTIETNKDTITATLTDEEGNPLANKKVTIKVNGKAYTKTTNSQGQVIIKYPNAWDYKVTANFAGDEKYLASKATAPKRTPTKVTIKTEGDKITATLTDKDGNPLANKKLIFRVKGVVIGVGITDANGQVVIYYKNANKKVITVSFEGDSEYMPSSATSTPESDNVQASGKVAMKKTGLPIIPILLALIASFGLLTLRKRE